MTLADHIVVMRSGEDRADRIPHGDLYSDPVSYFVADFFGSPSMNLVAGLTQAAAPSGRPLAAAVGAM